MSVRPIFGITTNSITATANEIGLGLDQPSLGPHLLLCLVGLVVVVLSVLRWQQSLCPSDDNEMNSEDDSDDETVKKEDVEKVSSQRPVPVPTLLQTNRHFRSLIAHVLSSSVIVSAIVLLWFYLLMIEKTVRSKQVEKVRVLAINEFMQRGFSYQSRDSERTELDKNHSTNSNQSTNESSKSFYHHYL